MDLLALRVAKLEAALEQIDTLACRTVSGSHPEDLPEPMPLDNEHISSICRLALRTEATP